MYRNHHETVLADNPPTPKQLHSLAQIGAGSAAERERLKVWRKSPEHRARYYIDEIDSYGVLETQEMIKIRRRMAGRIGIVANELAQKTWSLKIFDTYNVIQSDGDEARQRSLYEFMWTRSKVAVARRSMGIRTGAQETAPFDMADEIDRVMKYGVSDEDLMMWHAKSQLEQVTFDDCEVLIDDASKYYSQLVEPKIH